MAHAIYAARSSVSVDRDPKKDVFVSRTMAFVAGGFAGGEVLKVESGFGLLLFCGGEEGC